MHFSPWHPNAEWRKVRSEEHTSEPSHVEISYAVFCLKKKIGLRRVAQLSRQPPDGGGVVEPLAASVPHRSHRLPVVARTARLNAMDDRLSQEEYIRQVLEAYRKTPGTMGTVRRA